MAHAVMFSLFAIFVTAGVCYGNHVPYEHFVGKTNTRDRVPMDLALNKETMSIKFKSAADDVNNFRETTNLFVFDRKLVAIRDDVSNKCYIQQTDVTHDEVQEMIRNLDQDKDGSEFEIEEKDIIVTGLPSIISPELVRRTFGKDIFNHCLSHDVIHLGRGGRMRSHGFGEIAHIILKRTIRITITVRIGPIRIRVTIRI